MKKIVLTILIILIPSSLYSCDKEDGNILDYIGEYRWVDNIEETWHMFITGEKAKQSSQKYWWDEYKYNLKIKEDKTWFQGNSDKIITSGYSGQVKCYKDHICLIDTPSNYHIDKKFSFKFKEDSQGKWLQYYYDESVDKHGLDYDYTIRKIYFKFIK